MTPPDPVPTPDTAATVLAVIKRPHDDLSEGDFHQWISLDERVKADRNGRLNPRIFGLGNWVKWRCNNTECRAWAIVSDANGLLAIEEAESA